MVMMFLMILASFPRPHTRLFCTLCVYIPLIRGIPLNDSFVTMTTE